MKILELRFKNLNSLYGEWAIDFTSPEYVSNGIFAITGPTGAGKSTILDAICLALYGSTPRLGRITKNSNEIMSRQTGECYAEVTFESQTGKFRCHWSQHRARKKADGKLADTRHEISDAVSGHIIESKKRDVARVIEEKTGMDFDRFTRSILLAQGGFAVFLQATPDERAPVLEQITGTEIYSEISKRIHERQRDERGKLDLLQAETAGINILSEEQVAELSEDLSEKKKSEKTISTEYQDTGKSIQWLNTIDSLGRELDGISIEADSISAALKSFKPERERLDLAQKAAELEGKFASLSSGRLQQKADKDSLQKDEKLLPRAELTLSEKEESLTTAKSAFARAKTEQKSESPMIKQVRTLDLQISEKDKIIKADESDSKKTAEQLAAQTEKREKASELRNANRKGLEEVEKYLVDNSRDKSLITDLAGITVQVKNVQTAVDDISAKKGLVGEQKKQVEADSKLYETRQKIVITRKEEHGAAQTKTTESREILKVHLGDRSLREYRVEYDGLMREIGYLRKISDLEAERKKLTDGKPCPLCGSKEHPFAEGNVPEIDETEERIQNLNAFIEKAEELKSCIKEFEKIENKTATELAIAEKQLTDAGHKKDVSDKEIKRLTVDLAATTKRFIKLQDITLSQLLPFGITELPESNITSILSSLNDRLDQWKKYQQKKGDIEKKNNDLTSEIKQLNGIIETIGRTLSEKQVSITTLKNECEQLVKERKKLYGSKNPDKEDIRLETKISKTEKLEKAARDAHDQTKQQVAEIKTRIGTLEGNISRRESELESLEKAFLAACIKAGFPDEKIFYGSRLSPEERKQLYNRAKELDEEQVVILARKKDRKKRLDQEMEKKITESSMEDLKKSYDELEDFLRKIGEEIGALKQKLSDHNDARAKIKEKQGVIDDQKKECQRWDILHSLIGSADGKKYRNFAQGLTFELMVSHANRQLEKMTDRYLLIRDDDQPLELNVVDNYQAGEIRSTKNLSGGESFIVSLSLALGLSKMASRKVRVDSLFLDEGFGTLDEEALETALETLAGLQQDGKLIGIISHVSALKERISTQINILPVSGGKSTIIGPACRMIEVSEDKPN